MPAGIEIRNDGGFLQIDQDYRNSMLLSKWSGTTYESGDFWALSGDRFQEIQVNFNSQLPLLGVSCAYQIALIDMVHNPSSPFPNYMRFFINNPTPVPVTFYAFGPQVASGGNYGLQVFNAAGTVAFDALNLPLRVAGQIITPADGGVYTYPAGRTYAIMISEYIGFVDAPNTWPMDPLRFWTRFARLSGNTVYTNEVQHNGNPPWSILANQLYDNRAGRILIADVTNY